MLKSPDPVAKKSTSTSSVSDVARTSVKQYMQVDASPSHKRKHSAKNSANDEMEMDLGIEEDEGGSDIEGLEADLNMYFGYDEHNIENQS